MKLRPLNPRYHSEWNRTDIVVALDGQDRKCQKRVFTNKISVALGSQNEKCQHEGWKVNRFDSWRSRRKAPRVFSVDLHSRWFFCPLLLLRVNSSPVFPGPEVFVVEFGKVSHVVYRLTTGFDIGKQSAKFCPLLDTIFKVKFDCFISALI